MTAIKSVFFATLAIREVQALNLNFESYAEDFKDFTGSL